MVRMRSAMLAFSLHDSKAAHRVVLEQMNSKYTNAKNLQHQFNDYTSTTLLSFSCSANVSPYSSSTRLHCSSSSTLAFLFPSSVYVVVTDEFLLDLLFESLRPALVMCRRYQLECLTRNGSSHGSMKCEPESSGRSMGRLVIIGAPAIAA
jgi:hypothetical protein